MCAREGGGVVLDCKLQYVVRQIIELKLIMNGRSFEKIKTKEESPEISDFPSHINKLICLGYV